MQSHADSIDRDTPVGIRNPVLPTIFERNLGTPRLKSFAINAAIESAPPLHHPFTIYLLHVFPHRGAKISSHVFYKCQLARAISQQ